jgi:ribonuclease-3
MSATPLDPVCKALGHSFKTPGLLVEALSHPSLDAPINYQRLEFLGDRVLGLVIADELLARFPEASEGELALRLNALVRRETLAEVALKVGLDRHMRLSRSEEDSQGRRKPAALADVCEAVIAALYRDGGLKTASAFIATHWDSLIEAQTRAPQDAKSELQEWAQGRGLAAPVYREISREGPAHRPTFTIEVAVAGHAPEQGVGGSKREAEQRAAATLLARVTGA